MGLAGISDPVTRVAEIFQSEKGSDSSRVIEANRWISNPSAEKI